MALCDVANANFLQPLRCDWERDRVRKTGCLRDLWLIRCRTLDFDERESVPRVEIRPSWVDKGHELCIRVTAGPANDVRSSGGEGMRQPKLQIPAT